MGAQLARRERAHGAAVVVQPAGGQAQLSAVDSLLRATWVREGTGTSPRNGRRTSARSAGSRTYLATLDPDIEPLAVERTVGAKTAALALSGRVDRIDDVGGELVIVDYKTGRTGLDADDARGSRALALYAFAAQRLFRRPCHRVELHHLPTGTVAAHEHTEESIARHVRRAEQTAADAMAAEKAVAAGGRSGRGVPHHSGCDLRLVRLPTGLPGGLGATRTRQWAGLDRRQEAVVAE